MMNTETKTETNLEIGVHAMRPQLVFSSAKLHEMVLQRWLTIANWARQLSLVDSNIGIQHAMNWTKGRNVPGANQLPIICTTLSVIRPFDELYEEKAMKEEAN